MTSAVKKFERDAVSFTALGVEEDGSLVAAAGFDGLIHCWQSEPKQKYLGALPAGTVAPAHARKSQSSRSSPSHSKKKTRRKSCCSLEPRKAS